MRIFKIEIKPKSIPDIGLTNTISLFSFIPTILILFTFLFHNVYAGTKDKINIKEADFTVGKDVNLIKNKEIIKSKNGKNNVSINYVKNEILLKFNSGVSKEKNNEILKKYNLTQISSNEISKIGYIKVKAPDEIDVESIFKFQNETFYNLT